MPSEKPAHIWTDEALTRLLGTRDGFAHALVRVHQELARYAEMRNRIPTRHGRKLAAAERVVRPLRELYASLRESHDSVRETYNTEFARAKAAKAAPIQQPGDVGYRSGGDAEAKRIDAIKAAGRTQ